MVRFRLSWREDANADTGDPNDSLFSKEVSGRLRSRGRNDACGVNGSLGVYRTQLNPAEGGTSTQTVTACTGATHYKAFASEATPAQNYAYTKDIDGYCDFLSVRVYYVASNGGWAGFSSWNFAYDDDNLAYTSTTGNVDYSQHEGD